MTRDPGRSRPAHHPVAEFSNREFVVFVTVCTKGRAAVLANPSMHALLRRWWGEAGRWSVGCYMILPDHIHLFCAPNTIPPTSLRAWVAFWKNGVARDCPEAQPLWQRDFWDTQIRSGDGFTAKWDYVRGNPVRHGLVERAEDWLYQGEIARLAW